jgi:hypothetical protein
MTKYFDNTLADEIGYGAATQIAAVAQELHTFIETANAVRKAAGRPTIEEEEDQSRAEFREMMDEGHRFDPDVEAWARGE